MPSGLVSPEASSWLIDGYFLSVSSHGISSMYRYPWLVGRSVGLSFSSYKDPCDVVAGSYIAHCLW